MRTERAHVFDEIYRENRWNGVHGVGSGPGSSPAATERLAEALGIWINRYGILSVIDAGCGDGRWQPNLPGYVGIDIVPDVIERNRAARPDRTYEVGDFVTDELPACDAVLCRDALQHLSLEDGIAALANFALAGARFIFASSHRDHYNREIAAGDWFPVNLETSPYGLGDPLKFVPDNVWPDGPSPWPDKIFGVWTL